MLADLRRCPAIVGAPDEIAEGLLRLLPVTPDPALPPRERGVITLQYAECLRVLGRGDAAVKALDLACSLLVGVADTSDYAIPFVLRAHDRLGRFSEATDLGRELLPRFAQEFAKDHERDLCACAWLDQAERALRVKHEAAIDEAIAEARRRLERFEGAWTTWLSARLDTARARRSALKGDQGQARRLQQSARKALKRRASST